MATISQLRNVLLRPKRLWKISEIADNDELVETTAGVYAWYFSRIPSKVPRRNLHHFDGHTLLYIGIGPSSANSKQTLRKRLLCHTRKKASSSTLRRTLGSLLAEQLQLIPQTHGNVGKLTFGTDGEKRLNEWMERSARMCWVPHKQPWLIEPEIIKSLQLPFDLMHNQANSFRSDLLACRAAQQHLAAAASPNKPSQPIARRRAPAER